MAKHRSVSARPRRARTIVAGALAAGGLLIAGPAATAFAGTGGDTEPDGTHESPSDLGDAGVAGRVLNNTPIGNVIEFGPKSILAGNGTEDLPGTPIWNTLVGPIDEQEPFVWLNGKPWPECQCSAGGGGGQGGGAGGA